LRPFSRWLTVYMMWVYVCIYIHIYIYICVYDFVFTILYLLVASILQPEIESRKSLDPGPPQSTTPSSKGLWDSRSFLGGSMDHVNKGLPPSNVTGRWDIPRYILSSWALIGNSQLSMGISGS
jgi:hypothetical protein